MSTTHWGGGCLPRHRLAHMTLEQVSLISMQAVTGKFVWKIFCNLGHFNFRASKLILGKDLWRLLSKINENNVEYFGLKSMLQITLSGEKINCDDKSPHELLCLCVDQCEEGIFRTADDKRPQVSAATSCSVLLSPSNFNSILFNWHFSDTNLVKMMMEINGNLSWLAIMKELSVFVQGPVSSSFF